MKVLITGSGQLAQELLKCAPVDASVAIITRAACDITNASDVVKCVSETSPDLVINTAAFTSVDKAESARAEAFAVNAFGAENVARSAQSAGARLIHFSTDYVFDGARMTPYPPEEPTAPLNVYGESKAAGEVAVLNAHPDAIVLRCGWLYSRSARNFLTRMLDLMHREQSVRVVDDQIGVPTLASDLAGAVWTLAGKNVARGILHWTNAGVASWYEFATAIAEAAISAGQLRPGVDVIPVRTSEYRTPARRPAYSVLDARACWQITGTPDDWRVALRRLINYPP